MVIFLAFRQTRSPGKETGSGQPVLVRVVCLSFLCPAHLSPKMVMDFANPLGRGMGSAVIWVIGRRWGQVALPAGFLVI